MKEEKIKELIGTIEKDNIKPAPEWRVWLERGWPWILVGVMIALAAVALTLLLGPLFDIDSKILHALGPNRATHVVANTFAHIWLIMLIIFGFIGLIAFRHTETGYRHRILFIIGGLAIAISALAIGTHMAHMNENIEAFIEGGTPEFLRPFAPPRRNRLFNPGSGVLVGIVTKILPGSFTLIDPMQNEWQVSYDEKTEFEDDLALENDIRILIVGTLKDGGIFQADIIRPFIHERPRMMMLNTYLRPPIHMGA